MSLYWVNKVNHLLQVDPSFRSRMAHDPAEAIAELPLSDEERRAIVAGDVAALYEMGAHSFLLSRIPRFLPDRLDRDTYIERMRTLLSAEDRRAVEAATARATNVP